MCFAERSGEVADWHMVKDELRECEDVAACDCVAIYLVTCAIEMNCYALPFVLSCTSYEEAYCKTFAEVYVFLQ